MSRPAVVFIPLVGCAVYWRKNNFVCSYVSRSCLALSFLDRNVNHFGMSCNLDFCLIFLFLIIVVAVVRFAIGK
jgi:hypothetical protein